jgi:hypothetical protein
MEVQTAIVLTEKEWQTLASICWGWKRYTDSVQQAILPHYVELCDRIIAVVDGEPEVEPEVASR